MRQIWPANVKVVKAGVEEVVEEGVRFTGHTHITQVNHENGAQSVKLFLVKIIWLEICIKKLI